MGKSMSCLHLDEVLWLKKRLTIIINPSSNNPVPPCDLVLPADPPVQVVQLQLKVRSTNTPKSQPLCCLHEGRDFTAHWLLVPRNVLPDEALKRFPLLVVLCGYNGRLNIEVQHLLVFNGPVLSRLVAILPQTANQSLKTHPF